MNKGTKTPINGTTKDTSVVWKRLTGKYRIVHTAALPNNLTPPYFWALTATEGSLLCRAEEVPAGAEPSGEYCGIYALGMLDFSLVGILHRVTEALKTAEMSLLAQSTFDTDYVFWRADDEMKGLRALKEAGITVL